MKPVVGVRYTFKLTGVLARGRLSSPVNQVRELQKLLEAESSRMRGIKAEDLQQRISVLEGEREAALQREEEVLTKLVLLEKERRCKVTEREAEGKRVELLQQEKEVAQAAEEALKRRLAAVEEDNAARARMRELDSHRLTTLEREREMVLKREEEMLAKLLQLEVTFFVMPDERAHSACVCQHLGASCVQRCPITTFIPVVKVRMIRKDNKGAGVRLGWQARRITNRLRASATCF